MNQRRGRQVSMLDGCQFLAFFMFCMWLAADDAIFGNLRIWARMYMSEMFYVFLPKWNNRPALRVFINFGTKDNIEFDTDTPHCDAAAQRFRPVITAPTEVVQNIIKQYFHKQRIITEWLQNSMGELRWPTFINQAVRTFSMPTTNAIDMVTNLLDVLGIYEHKFLMENLKLKLDQRWAKMIRSDFPKKRKQPDVIILHVTE